MWHLCFVFCLQGLPTPAAHGAHTGHHPPPASCLLCLLQSPLAPPEHQFCCTSSLFGASGPSMFHRASAMAVGHGVQSPQLHHLQAVSSCHLFWRALTTTPFSFPLSGRVFLSSTVSAALFLAAASFRAATSVLCINGLLRNRSVFRVRKF